MKLLPLMFLLLLSVNECKSQRKISLEKVFVKSFIKDHKGDMRFFSDNKLIIFGTGNDYYEGEIHVIFLSLEEINKKVKQDGEFMLVSMNEIILEGNILTTTFDFLIAIKDKDYDFAAMDNLEGTYCIKLACDTKEQFRVYSCNNK